MLSLTRSTGSGSIEPAQLRRLRIALVISMVCHGLVLSGLHGIIEQRLSPPVRILHAELRQAAAAPAEPESARSADPLAGRTPTRPSREPSPVKTSKPASPIVVSTESAAPERTNAAPTPVLAEPGLGESPRSVEVPKPVAEPRPGYDGEDLRQYKLAVASQARRYKRYPALARERGWEGTAEIAVSLLPESPMPLVAIEKSSGFPVLDDQAVEMIRRASRAASIPPGMQQRGVRFVLPVHFSLDE